MTQRTDAITPWKTAEHPQLGPIEVGGLNYMKTVRNPPDSELARNFIEAIWSLNS